MVGAVRFELTTSWTRTTRASQATLRPDLQAVKLHRPPPFCKSDFVVTRESFGADPRHVVPHFAGAPVFMRALAERVADFVAGAPTFANATSPSATPSRSLPNEKPMTTTPPSGTATPLCLLQNWGIVWTLCAWSLVIASCPHPALAFPICRKHCGAFFEELRSTE
jgi:hypothetical protein